MYVYGLIRPAMNENRRRNMPESNQFKRIKKKKEIKSINQRIQKWH